MTCSVSCVYSNRLTYETVKQRNTGNGECCCEEAKANKGHLLRHIAKLVDVTNTSCIHNGTSAHKEQGFKENIAESMGSCTVHSKTSTNACACNHKTSLTDDMVSQESAHIVFHNRVACTVECHQYATPHNQFATCEHAEQCVNCNLSSQAAHEYATSNGGVCISIYQPSVDRRHCHVYTNTNEHQPVSIIVRTIYHIGNGGIAAMTQMQENTCQKQVTAKHMNQEVTETGTTRNFTIFTPYQEYGSYCHCFPEENQGQPVFRKSYTNGAACVSHSTESFHTVFIMTSINTADKCQHRKDKGENPAEFIDMENT